MLQADDLKKAFPWLGTDQDVTGSDIIDQLNDAYEAALAEEKKQKKLRRKYLQWAQDQEQEGHIEVDDAPLVSEGDDAGAYVACWMWVSDEEAKAANARRSK